RAGKVDVFIDGNLKTEVLTTLGEATSEQDLQKEVYEARCAQSSIKMLMMAVEASKKEPEKCDPKFTKLRDKEVAWALGFREGLDGNTRIEEFDDGTKYVFPPKSKFEGRTYYKGFSRGWYLRRAILMAQGEDDIGFPPVLEYRD